MKPRYGTLVRALADAKRTIEWGYLNALGPDELKQPPNYEAWRLCARIQRLVERAEGRK